MKTKALYPLASAVLLSMAFAACTDEMQEEAILQPQALKQIVMTTQDFQPEVAGRTVYQIADGAVKCTWAAHDTVGVFPNKGAQAYFPMSSGAGTKNATFDGEGWALKDGSTYGAYYPFIGELFLDRHAVPVSYMGQKQVGNASLAHLGDYDYMVAPPATPEFGSAQFMFKHLSALVQLKITVPQPVKCHSLKLVAEGNVFAVEGKVDIMATTPRITPITTTKEIMLDLQDVATTEKNQVLTFYLMLPPTNLSSRTLKAVLTTDRGEEKIALESKNFQAGTAYALSGELKTVEGSYKNGVVTLGEAGTMNLLLGNGYLDITSLKVVGPINGDDVIYLRQMLGSKDFSEAERGKLAKLDLSEATIVEGGDYYLHVGASFYRTSDNVIGANMFRYCVNLQEITLPNSITTIDELAFDGCTSLPSVDIPDGVTSIGHKVFWNCSSLVSIDIPDGVIEIGSWAFAHCPSLVSVAIPKGVTKIDNYTFANCTSLVSIDIPDNVTELGAGIFKGSSSLASVTIGNGVTRIDYSAFEGCSSLTSIDIPDNVTEIGGSIFKNCSSLSSVTIGDGITKISHEAFSGCSSLVSIDIPDGVTIIESWAFPYCSSLPSIDIPDGVTKIGGAAFHRCSSLTSVDIPDGVTTIEEATFAECSSLTSVDIPDGVIVIGRHAFDGCTSLASIDIPDGVTKIEGYAFHKCTSLTTVDIPDSVTDMGAGVFRNCTSLAAINLSDNVTAIVAEAFANCHSLTSIDIPDSVTSIGYYAFINCTALTSVTIGDGVAFIDNNVFGHCPSLTSITIGSGIKEIFTSAFHGCEFLKELYCYATTPASIQNGMYSSFRAYGEETILYVPAGCKSVYESSDWGNYFVNIKEI